MAVLDTNYLIALEANEPSAIAWLAQNRGDEHHVPDFVVVEYLTGHSDSEGALEALAAAFTIAHGDPAWIRSATRLRQRLRAKKARFRSPDFWIAAWAVHLGTLVVTRNRSHFRELGAPVADW